VGPAERQTDSGGRQRFPPPFVTVLQQEVSFVCFWIMRYANGFWMGATSVLPVSRDLQFPFRAAGGKLLTLVSAARDRSLSSNACLKGLGEIGDRRTGGVVGCPNGTAVVLRTGEASGGFANALAVLPAWSEIRTLQDAWKAAWRALVGSGAGSGHEGEEWRCSRKDWI
jgi:hypothetical protein